MRCLSVLGVLFFFVFKGSNKLSHLPCLPYILDECMYVWLVVFQIVFLYGSKI